VTKKENKNILKYKDHAIYVQHILNVKTKTISLIKKETGIILLSFTKKLDSLPSKTLRRVLA